MDERGAELEEARRRVETLRDWLMVGGWLLLFFEFAAYALWSRWAALAVSLLGLAASAYVSLRNLELSSEYRIRTKYGFFFRRSHPYTLFFCFLFLSIAAFVN